MIGRIEYNSVIGVIEEERLNKLTRIWRGWTITRGNGKIQTLGFS